MTVGPSVHYLSRIFVLRMAKFCLPIGRRMASRAFAPNSTLSEKCSIPVRSRFQDKCYSCLDMATELQHTVWSWLFRATEMIQDVGHKLCPSPNLGEKKVTKTKKQMAASEEYQTMLSLFNKG